MPESPEIPQELPLADGAVWTAEIHTNKEKKKEETPVLDVHPAHHAVSTWKEFFDHMLPVFGRHTVPLNFSAPTDTADAALEITGTGSGDFHIGAVSVMPADNIDGFRPDVIALFRQINMGFWRYGGNYTSNLVWYHTIGDPDKRPPDWDNAWGAMQPNDLGMDEFMTFCRLIGVEAYISVNAGLGDSHSAAEQVEYMNGPVSTPMGALRAKNGHPEPYHIKFWNIGNEPWGSWQIGRTDTKYFMQKHNEFAKAMREVDPSIVLIASGRMLQDDGLHGDDRKYVGNLQPIYGSPADWTGNFLSKTWGNFDGIAEHWYSHPGRRYDTAKLQTLAPEASDDDAYRQGRPDAAGVGALGRQCGSQ